MSDTTTELEVLDEIVDVLGGQSGQYKTVVPVLEDIRDLLGGGGGGGGYNPSLSVGRADALTGADSTAQWAQRTTEGSGAATVRSVQGAAVGWNQLIESAYPSSTNNGVTFTNNGDGTWTVDGTATANAHNYVHFLTTSIIKLTLGHTYLYKGCPSGGSLTTYYMRDSYNARAADAGNGVIFTYSTGDANFQPNLLVMAGTTVSSIVFIPQLFDLTQMFGSGNEPSTVAEFEQMFPASYYPYSAPTLKPVQIAGIRSVGFNQWDEEWELGAISATTGQNVSDSNTIRSKNYDSCFPDTNYYINAPVFIYVFWYDAGKNYISNTYTRNNIRQSPANAAYFRIRVDGTATYNHNICINVSNPALNGQYKPYTTDAIEWTAQTLRAAGSVADMLTADELITRVGVVQVTGGSSSTIAQSTDGTCINALVFIPNYDSITSGGISSDQFTETSAGWRTVGLYEVHNASASGGVFIGLPLDVSTQAQVNAWLAEHKPTFWYELATPTTQPISPSLPMTYRVQAGGSESIIVPDGEISAAPVLTIAEDESAADVVMDALACIATPDGPVATANHAVGTYLTMQGKLYKVTSAIAVGETITPNTNVSQTTVMAELIARTA